jgi:hypothetical protein
MCLESLLLLIDLIYIEILKFYAGEDAMLHTPLKAVFASYRFNYEYRTVLVQVPDPAVGLLPSR